MSCVLIGVCCAWCMVVNALHSVWCWYSVSMVFVCGACIVYGVCGVQCRCNVYGACCMVYCICCVVYGICCVVYGVRCMV